MPSSIGHRLPMFVREEGRCSRAAGNRVSHESASIWGLSSVGRAIALQAIGHRFDPVSLHQERLVA